MTAQSPRLDELLEESQDTQSDAMAATREPLAALVESGHEQADSNPSAETGKREPDASTKASSISSGISPARSFAMKTALEAITVSAAFHSVAEKTRISMRTR